MLEISLKLTNPKSPQLTSHGPAGISGIMAGMRKKFGRNGIFAAFFFAAFAILASFHYHELSGGEASSHHCAVCHNSSHAKVLTKEPTALEAPTLACQNFEILEASQSFAPAPTGSDPIRGPPLA